MNKDYLTIKEFAATVGVSQQAIYKQLNNKLKTYLKIVDNKKMLEKSALKLFEAKENLNQVEQQLNNKLNDKLIDMLQKELEEKGQQLKEKDKQIAELNKALDQAQKLHAMDKQRILELEDKTAEPEEPIQEPTKKKWWKFGK